MHALGRMLARLRRRTLTLHVEGHKHVFGSPQELAAFLRPRTRVPDDRLEEFAAYDEHGLKREARKLLHAHQNVTTMMVGTKETGEPYLAVWRHLDISKVPDDHDWPSILFALGKESGAADAYRHVALTQYLDFLEKRRSALEGFRKPDAAAPVAEDAGDPQAHRTLQGYARLPHCHAVEVDLGEQQDVTLFLGTNRYHLSRHAGEVAFEEGAAGKPHVLKPGRSTVGRSSNCDVRLEHDLRDISRRHLVVEVSSGRRVSVMDVSSRGTYMRDARFVDAHSDTLADADP